MTDAINGSRVGSPGSGSLANTLARELNSAKDRIAELEKTAARVVECDTCGNPWCHDWLSPETCPHCALAASQGALERIRKRSQNQRRELRRLNNTLRWLWDGVRYAHAMEAKMRADKELGDAKKLAKFWEETAGSLKQEVIDLMHGCRTHNVHDAR